MQAKKNVKNKPLKKIAETDAIFESVREENKKADEDADTIRISVDAKAKVLVGNLDRRGKSRQRKPQVADDHDTGIRDRLIPYGITNTKTGDLSFCFGRSKETSDFVADCIDAWLEGNLGKRTGEPDRITTLAVNLDNGPDQRSDRTQFLSRLVGMAKKYHMRIRLIYYPPYHSKYNPIEHAFGVLERFWSGAILDTVGAVLNWAGNVVWKRKKPVSVRFIDKDYETGVTLSKEEMKPVLAHIVRSPTLPKWSLCIYPEIV